MIATEVRPAAPQVRRYAPDSTLAPHTHEQSWLCFVVDGNYQERIRSREQDHQFGDLLCCPSHTVHAQTFGPAGSIKILWAPEQGSLDYLAARGVVLDDAPCLKRSSDVTNLGTRLWRELNIDDAFASLAVQGLTLELLATFGRRGHCDDMRRRPRWLLQIKQRIDESASVDPLTDLAAEVGRHPVHVARSFRAAFGCTIGGYARRIRAEKAAALLRSTKRPLIEIALESGYGSASQFSRSFKEIFGVAPSVFRMHSR